MTEPCTQSERISRHGMEIDALVKDFEKHVNTGKAWRIAVVGSVVMIALQLVSFVYLYGQLVATVDFNQKVIAKIEHKVYP